ncbi:hypothetical protein H2199_008445 [Coniosporium tulheliwenetii]|uniref:Uncharacterized protein n=1 Tax=Coniosporium tulheliwenetii TaxID=3383036 RepID=A0ACC2YJE1_9PEZI|nr:hypothetical protein H2199_008445 [Cladosporium sp. JES 115]
MSRTTTLLGIFGPVVVSAIPQRGNFIGMAQCSSRPGITRMTVEQCERDCGTGWHPYEKWEVVGAMGTWVIPLFVLVGNMHFSNSALDLFSLSSPPVPASGGSESDAARTAWSVFINYGFVASHLLGNPIDVIWSHLEKLEHMRQIREQRQEPGRPRDNAALAIICIILDDFEFDHGTRYTAETAAPRKLSEILVSHKDSLEHAARVKFLKKCRDAAFHLADTRTSSTRRAALAVIAYAVALFISLASAMAQNSAAVHTPHTLALRELYYWLISAIALSSATGAFPTEYTARAALKDVLPAISDSEFKLAPLKIWTGGSYCYRPHKLIKRRSIPLLGLSILAVGGAWAFSFTMSWITPTRGLGCRSFMELGFFGAWVLNFFVSYCIARIVHRKWPKAAFVATCKCWAAFWTISGAAAHYVPVDLAAKEQALAPTYFALLACALGLQVLLSGGILKYYRRELWLIYGGPWEGRVPK